MPDKLGKNYYKYTDYLLIFLPIVIILGSPTINFFLITSSVLFLYLSIKYKFWIWLKITWVRLFIVFWLNIDDKQKYIEEVIKSDFAEAGDDDVFRKVKADFDNKNISNDQEIRSKMDELLEQVKKDFL